MNQRPYRKTELTEMRRCTHYSSVERHMCMYKITCSEVKMSIEEFVVEILEENKEDIDDLVRLQEILDQLPKEESKTYFVSITSNL